MITRLNFVQNRKELDSIAARYVEDFLDIADVANISFAAKAAANAYSEASETFMREALAATAKDSIKYYNSALETPLSDEVQEALLLRVLSQQDNNKYYGFNLKQRFAFARKLFAVNILRASLVGSNPDTKLKNVTRAFNASYPVGSQVARDKKLLLSETVRLEQMVAKEVANEAELPFIRWTLSKSHVHTDICDELASEVSTEVISYLENLNSDLDPKGLYFVNELPALPHPNCTCNFELVSGTADIKRPKKNLWSLVSKIFARRKR